VVNDDHRAVEQREAVRVQVLFQIGLTDAPQRLEAKSLSVKRMAMVLPSFCIVPMKECLPSVRA
jgi:hypothetical protein